MYLEWRQNFSVGISEIDDQHKKILSIINDLYKVGNSNLKKDDLVSTIKTLKEYADYHFRTEQKYFDMYKYPKKQEHLGSHNYYIDKVNNLEKKCLDSLNNNNLLAELMEFLASWWIGHIQKEDMEYSLYFKEEGII